MFLRIKPKFTKADITKMIQQRKDLLNDLILLELQKIGEQFIIDARETDTYKDQTGNLRSSIGYVILYNGFQYDGGGFVEIKEGGEGVRVGREVIDEIAKKYPKGWVFIAVADQNYAAAVEAKGFDVITTSSITAAIELKTAMERIRKKLSKK